MATFIMLTRVAPEALRTPHGLEALERHASDRIKAECPDVRWIHNYAVLGPHDYVDIFQAPDIATAMKVAALVRTYGQAHTEVWSAVEWPAFKEILHSLPEPFVAQAEAVAP
jgi:uncharacterized protein with GYD domain